MDYKVIVTTSRIKKLAIACWLSAIFITVLALVMRLTGVDNKVVENYSIGESLFGGFALILLVYFYVMAYLGIRKRKITEIHEVTAQVKANLESKVAKTTGLLTAVVLFSFLPVGLAYCLLIFFPVLGMYSIFQTTVTLLQFNSLLNPLLYSYRDSRIRKALLELFGIRKPKAIRPTAGATVRQQARRDSRREMKQIRNAKKPSCMLRSKSCKPAVVSECVHRNKIFKRSMSAPTLYNSYFDGQLFRQQNSSILTTTAIIHAESGV